MQPQLSRDFNIDPKLSIVIPCFNEEERIFRLRQGVLDYLSAADGLPTEIIFVNDGSTDSTSTRLHILVKEIDKLYGQHAKVIDLHKNLGKGGALRAGVLQSSGKWVLTADADMAAPLTEVLQWKQQLFNTDDQRLRDIYIGNRRHGESSNSFLRSRLSNTYSKFIASLTGLSVVDSQCGFKLYPREIAEAAFLRLQEMGWAHDVEILSRIVQSGYSIVSFPVRWQAISGSKVRVIRDGVKMLFSHQN